VRRRLIQSLMAVWFAAQAASAAADIVVNHQPLNSGGPASDLAFINDSNQQSWQQLADDFQVAQDAEIRLIVFWGFYGSGFSEEVEPPPETETMRVRAYGARPGDGLPGNILYEQSFEDPSRTATGRIIFDGPGPPEFRYQVDLTTPLLLQAGTTYWLEIVQNADIDSLFRWEFSAGTQTPFAFINPFLSDWRRTTITPDLAFELSTIPEPSSLLLCTFCLILWRRR
jgi:hypothetical protein